ncbi:TIR domain-containing protein [Pedobacter lithocola]|nr:nucleotide-binding protein [Pedobacter petrophilus]
MKAQQKHYIDQIEEFKGLVIQYYNNPTLDIRTKISKGILNIQKIVRNAGTEKRVTISPPPMVGGYQLSNANPFDLIFDAPYGMDMTTVIIDILDSTVGVIEHNKDFNVTNPKKQTAKKLPGKSNSKKIFLVHGHDNELKEKTARFLEKLGLEPIILHEQSNQGKTIIEKFEANSDVAYAIVLLSPDDVGRSIKDNSEKQNFRARQNVIFELGYFIGKLGRQSVCGLLKGAIETPSDYDGILYIQYDEADGWKLLLAKEMKNAGLSVNLNNAI